MGMRWHEPKYKNQKVVVDGMKFDSKKEARRFCELRILEKAGEISDLKCQVRYELIPEQRERTNEIYKSGKNKGKFKPGKVLERKVEYIADFVYVQNGKIVVEDVKGYKNGSAYNIFKIKRKLMLYRYGIKIVEI